MSIQIPYGEGKKELRLPPEIRTDFLAPASGPPIENLESAFLSACREPIGTTPLDETLSDESSVVILVADLTRSKGTEVLLPICVRYLEELGVPRESVTVLIARGTHRKLTKEEKEFFKTDSLSGVHVEEHDCDDTDRLSALLLTRHGTPVRTNVILKDADAIILLSPVSFHYFAGFGGGRKLVLPGSADRNSILTNHRLSLIDAKPATLHPRCRPGRLDGNPVHEDMCETVEALNGVFGINFFGGAEGDVVFLNAGDPLRAHREACDAYRNIHLQHVEAPYDVMIVSAGGYPYDINFLQSHKAIRHAAGAMKNGGTILYYAECAEGIGSASLEAALRMRKDKFLNTAYEKYDLNNQTAVSLHDLTGRFEVGMVSAMNVDVLLSSGIKPCVNAEAYLAEALERRVSDRVAVVMNGSTLLFDDGGGRG